MKKTASHKAFVGLPVRILAVGVALIANQLAAAESDTRPINEQLTTAAWDAYNAENFQEAIAKAGECIALFHHDADRMQDELKNKMPPEPPPPVGKVSDVIREVILNRGPLNDVATCYFIQGESFRRLVARAKGADQKNSAKEEQKFSLKDAKKAYDKAAYYTYARTWDPNGWFWDPAKTANDRISDLPAM